jgi:hypothetical protein
MLIEEGRSRDTAMRDLLRRLDRASTYVPPARPTELPEPLLLAMTAAPADPVAVGRWVPHTDPDTGTQTWQLIFTDPDGNDHVLIPPGGP